MYCMNCGNQLKSESVKFCPGCGKETKTDVNDTKKEFTAPKPFAPYSSIDPNQGIVNKTAFKGKQKSVGTSGEIKFSKKGKGCFRKVILAFALLTVLAVAVIILSGGGNDLKLGSENKLASVIMTSSGGQIDIKDDPVLSGMKIEISTGSFDSSINYSVSSKEIISHDFGDEINPITPMITIDNGHIFAKKPMKVTIPISIKDNEFAMGFYYDKTTRSLEAIPFESVDSNHITLMTAHFSDIFISKIDKAKIDEAGRIDTGFEPGKDDWQFINYGSALAPAGHCAGQSLTMAWYYFEQKQNGKEPALYGVYDNNGASPTKDFWQDDSLGYRFSSVIQESINWTSSEFQSYINIENQDQKDTYYAFAYAMMATGQPQFMGIYSHDASGNRTGGHAIVAYRVDGNRIYVADPNYPSQKDRYVTLSNGAFLPYSSGSNAADINTNGTLLYDEFIFVAKTALVDFETIAKNYIKLQDKTIGEGLMPTLEIAYMSKYIPDDESSSEWTVMDQKINYKKDVSYPAEYEGQLLIGAATEYTDVVYTLYSGTDPVEGPYHASEDGVAYFTLLLEEGANDYGILAQVLIGEDLYFADFKRITVEYSSKSDSGISISTARYKDIKTASLIDSSNNPVTITNSFLPDDPFIYITGSIVNAPEGTRIKARWIYEGSDPETFIDEAEYQTKDIDSTFVFSLSKPVNGWPTGNYRAELYIDGKLKDTIVFDVIDKSGKSIDAGHLEGVYIYEMYEGDLQYNITYQSYTLNADKTYSEKFEWTSKSSTQKTTGEGKGTWMVEGNELILTNDSNFKTIFEISDDRLIQKVEIGFKTGKYALVYFKKE